MNFKRDRPLLFFNNVTYKLAEVPATREQKIMDYISRKIYSMGAISTWLLLIFQTHIVTLQKLVDSSSHLSIFDFFFFI